MPVTDRSEIVDTESSRETVAESVRVLVVRKPNEYEAGRVEGAILVPLGGVDRLPRAQLVLAY